MSDKYKNKYRIASNRWQYWDYSAPGSYFITICIAHRACILGDVVGGKMQLSPYGEIVKNEFLKIPEYHPRALLDAWVVMPNHVHCIITLGDYDFHNGVSTVYPKTDNGDGNNGGDGNENGNENGNVEKIHEFSLPIPPIPPPPSFPSSPPDILTTPDAIKQYRKQRRRMIIPKITGKFQMQTSKQINILRQTPGTKNWQANYHDHVIRNPASYERIKWYIIHNPQKWEEDKFFNNG